MSINATSPTATPMNVDLDMVVRRLMVLEHYADLITAEIDLLHQLLPALRTPELGLDLAAPPVQQPIGGYILRKWSKIDKLPDGVTLRPYQGRVGKRSEAARTAARRSPSAQVGRACPAK